MILPTKPRPATAFWWIVSQPGEFVDITGISKGKGFAGGVKRWHFARRRRDARVHASTALPEALAAARFRRAYGRGSIFRDTWAIASA